MINKKSKIIIGVNFLSLMVVFFASYSLATAEFDQTFKNAVSQLSKERIPRPVVRSDDQGRELVQNINFKIFGVTKEICNQEKIEPQNCRWNIKVVLSHFVSAESRAVHSTIRSSEYLQ